LKEEAFAACGHTDEVSRHANSVNTIVFEPGVATLGANTDGVGAIAAVAEALGVDELPPQLRILVLGAGPTARACAHALSRVGQASVLVWNRSEGRGQDLAERFALESWTDQRIAVAFAALPPNAELDDDIRRALLFAPVVIDANYGPRATLGAALGREVNDGMAMLRASARASFALWADADSLRRGGDSNSRDL
jgi:shikimate dehydrogenase